MMVKGENQYEGAWYQWTIHLKIINKVNFLLYVLYYSKEKVEKSKTKTFGDNQKVYHCICTRRNVNQYSLGWRSMVPDGNVDLCKVMMSSRNGQ